MTATSHALIGSSLATLITNPFLGIPAAIVSHFIADLIPHWDAGTNHKKKSIMRLRLEATADVLLGFGLSYIIFINQVDPIYLLTMIISAQLPDWLEAPSWMFGIKIPPFSWMDWLGHKLQSRMQLPWGIVTQIVTVGILLLLTADFPKVAQNLLSSLVLIS